MISEIIKNDLTNIINKNVRSLNSFFTKNVDYIFTLNTDPLKTNKIWFIVAENKSNKSKIFLMSFICDDIVANKIFNEICSLYVLLGFNILNKDNEEIIHDSYNKDLINLLKNNNTYHIYDDDISIKIESKSGLNSEILKIDSINKSKIAMMLRILLSALNKEIVSKDHSAILNKYGLVSNKSLEENTVEWISACCCGCQENCISIHNIDVLSAKYFHIPNSKLIFGINSDEEFIIKNIFDDFDSVFKDRFKFKINRLTEKVVPSSIEKTFYSKYDIKHFINKNLIDFIEKTGVYVCSVKLLEKKISSGNCSMLCMSIEENIFG